MNLACTTNKRGGITLVELDVTNPTRTARRIRIENVLAGEILPPRHHGTPVDGWDEEGVTVSVDAGEHVALGYACLARPKDPPARIVGSEPTDSAESSTRSAGSVLAALGDPRPPRDVVEPELGEGSSESEQGSDPPEQRTGRAGESEASKRPARSAMTDGRDHDTEGTERLEEDCRGGPNYRVSKDSETTEETDPAQIPPAIAAWLQMKAEQVTADESVDVKQLSAVARRAGEIASRAEQ